ncbi:MAG TPA: lactate racemase domain-containing protein [Candidatus Dormibacteraeota bacterium]|nr:lactate racemase domain-containing protein [Candidatus Dormibacteraeota bacterium]
MPRPGSVIEVDRNTPPTLFHYGEGVRLERLPQGSRIVYAPDPIQPIAHPERAIRRALSHPMDDDPLRSLLRPGMRLTIAFDDLSLPLPPMAQPDVRQLVLEEVIELAAAAGVEDVHLVAANSLHRRMTEDEMRHIVGDRIFTTFHPDRLYNHDAEDPDGNVLIGRTPHGEDVTLSRRAAESDLLVYVNLTFVPMDGGHKSLSTGLGSYRSVRVHHTVDTLLNSRSYMHPPDSALHQACIRQGQLIEDAVRCFHVETSVNNHSFPAIANFMQKRETDWTATDQAAFLAVKQLTDLAPAEVKRAVFHSMRAPYGLTAVHAGQVDAVHDATLAAVRRQMMVDVEGQTDIVTLGIPYLGPYNVNAILNPILVVCMGLGYLFNLYRGRPVVRQGGVVIMAHPCRNEFDSVQHPSYIDFFDEVLADTRDPAEIEQRYEGRFAEDAWYRQLYRRSHAYHGVHPFYAWYWAAHAMQHVGDVIVVGGERETVHHLGFKCATTLPDAFEMAEQTVGRYPSVTHLRLPPLFVADVS